MQELQHFHSFTLVDFIYFLHFLSHHFPLKLLLVHTFYFGLIYPDFFYDFTYKLRSLFFFLKWGLEVINNQVYRTRHEFLPAKQISNTVIRWLLGLIIGILLLHQKAPSLSGHYCCLQDLQLDKAVNFFSPPEAYIAFLTP